MRAPVVPTRTSTFPAPFRSIVHARSARSTMPKPETSSVGGIMIVRPSCVRNWFFRLSLPLMNGARYAMAPS